MAASIDNHQASLALTEFITLAGIFPPRDEDTDSGVGTGYTPMAVIRTFAGNFVPANDAQADGRLLSISQNTALFSLLETRFGGNGINTFALPDLRGQAIIGSGQGPGLDSHAVGDATGSAAIAITQPSLPASFDGSSLPIDNEQPSLPITYAIRTTGSVPSTTVGASQFLGEVIRFAGNFAPTGFMLCDGRSLLIAGNEELFGVIGRAYGGDATHFQLPDLRGRNAVGADAADPVGTQTGTHDLVLTNVQLPADMGGGGQAFDNEGPGLALRYIIALQGIFPSQPGSGGSADPTTPYLGEITLFAGDFAPRGWAFCDGSVLPISQNTALFSLLETRYGGNGINTFALPDLSGRTAIGTSADITVGTVLGSNSEHVLSSDIPNITVTGTAAGEALYGGGGNDHLNGVGGNDVLTGNAGNDVLDGGAGADTLKGGLGTDTLIGGLGDDAYLLDNGLDAVSNSGGGGDLISSTVTRSLMSYGSIERLYLAGSAIANGIGNNLANVVVGNSAANVLAGVGGNDALNGAAGKDQLFGGAGLDTLTGGTGNDFFVFNTTPNISTNRDFITDFVHGVDKLQMENAVFAKLGAAGVLNAAFFRTGTAALDANDYIVYDKSTGALFYDANGYAAGAAIQFATLTTRPTLSYLDFAVI